MGRKIELEEEVLEHSKTIDQIDAQINRHKSQQLNVQAEKENQEINFKKSKKSSKRAWIILEIVELESDATSFAKNTILSQKTKENQTLDSDILRKEERIRHLRKKRLCFAERKRVFCEKINAQMVSSIQREINQIIGEPKEFFSN